MTDLKKFDELLEQVYGEFTVLRDLKNLFLKHYNISEDEILKLARAIKLKRLKAIHEKYGKEIISNPDIREKPYCKKVDYDKIKELYFKKK